MWSKNKQYVDFTVEVIPTNAVLPSDARIVWEAEDPDDPSNEGIDVNNAAKEVLDPNDYDSIDNDGDGTADNSDGEDNTGGRDGASDWEEISADYALSGNETKIKDGTSQVRFNVTDDGGDNFIVKAKLKLSAGATPCEGDQTGVMTVWKKINIESVTMSTADALPVNDIPDRFTKAFVEFHIALSRSVSDGIVDNGTPPTKQWVMGLTEGSAYAACQDYVTAASGEFSHEGPEWFFVASAHEFIPLTSLTSEVLYPPSGTASNATASGTTITLPIAIATGKVPDVVYIYNASLSSNVLFSVKVGTLSVDRKTFEIEKKE
ncbi:MAG: hypothetical protein PHW45_04430 [Candidatus ainarchaeum sp.]|nr:hypothetical protein [Candidatus ainarchaeum sp.]